MTDTIEFPTIDAAAIAAPVAPAATQVAVIAPDATKIDLAKIDLEAVALAHFEASRAALAVATEKLTGVVHDLSTAGKLADAKSLRHRLINIPLADARKVSTSLKSKLTATSKAVGATLVSIESGFEAADVLITPQIEARDAELEAERQRKEAEAAARREKFGGLLSNIRGYGTAAKGLPAARILAGIAYVEDLTFGPEWEEYASQAAQAQAETLSVLRALHAEAVAAEQAAAAAEALRAENARLAAERAEQDRRMRDIQRINACVPEAQAATVGQTGDEAAVTLQRAIDLISPMDTSADGCNSFGPMASMADMAKTLVLAQLRSMLAEAKAHAESDRKAKQEAEDLAAAQVAAGMAEAARAAEKADAPVEIIDAEVDEKAERDHPDLQTAELACAAPAQAPVADAAPYSINVIEATPEQHAQRMSHRVEVAFPAEDSALWSSPAVKLAQEECAAFIADRYAGDPLIYIGDEPEDTLPALLAHIAKLDEMKFPSHPKPPQEWFTELRRLAAEAAQ